MARPLDQPFPAVTLDDAPHVDWWPVRPVVAMGGRQDVAMWDDPDNLWDVNDGGTVTANSARVGIGRVGTAKVGAQ